MTLLEQVARRANPDWETMSLNSRRNALITARVHVAALRGLGFSGWIPQWRSMIDAILEEK